LKPFRRLILLSLVLLGGLAIYTNVPTSLTADDKRVFAGIGLHPLAMPRTFEQEVAVIRQAQNEVFARAPYGAPIPERESREPADLMERVRHGLCYDRSRTLDKAFIYLGFESRHVYLLFKADRSFLGALFQRGQPSHAVTEVKTSRGWLFVDSNTPWIALTRQGQPVNADDVWRRVSEFDQMPPYLNAPWWAIRGMYSRKGHLYSQVSMFPEFNWRDFSNWLIH